MPRLYRECVSCACEFYVSEKDQAFFNSNGLELPKRCFACRPRNTIYKDCASCGREFYIVPEDQRFFRSRNLALPKRCWYCRKGIDPADPNQQQSQAPPQQKPPASDELVDFFVRDVRKDSRDWTDSWSDERQSKRKKVNR